MTNSDYVLHTPDEISAIREAAAAAAMVRDQLMQMVAAGMSTATVDDIAAGLIAATGGVSAFLGYRGFPGQICISVNDQVVHGIGRHDRILRAGDIVSVDVGVKLGNGIGDTAITFAVGKASDEVEMLLTQTEKALMEGCAAAECGNYVRNISTAVERVAKRAKLGIVREYVGHGCGTKLHEPPEVPNFVCGYKGPRLTPGMVLAIEPMLNLGTHKVVTEGDRWTVRTLDGKWSAHFEHMVLITENKPEILTCQKT